MKPFRHSARTSPSGEEAANGTVGGGLSVWCCVQTQLNPFVNKHTLFSPMTEPVPVPGPPPRPSQLPRSHPESEPELVLVLALFLFVTWGRGGEVTKSVASGNQMKNSCVAPKIAHRNSIKQNKINFSERISIVSGTVFAVVGGFRWVKSFLGLVLVLAWSWFCRCAGALPCPARLLFVVLSFQCSVRAFVFFSPLLRILFFSCGSGSGRRRNRSLHLPTRPSQEALYMDGMAMGQARRNCGCSWHSPKGSGQEK